MNGDMIAKESIWRKCDGCGANIFLVTGQVDGISRQGLPSLCRPCRAVADPNESRPYARFTTDVWLKRTVCATLPIIIVEILDVIAETTGQSRSAVIRDALLAYDEITGVLRELGDEVYQRPVVSAKE